MKLLLKLTSVLLSAVMCASMIAPVSVMADDAAPEETQVTEAAEEKETKETTKPAPKASEKPETEETEKKETEAPETQKPEETEPEESTKPAESEKPAEPKESEPEETAKPAEPAETEEQKPEETEVTEPSGSEASVPEAKVPEEPAVSEKAKANKAEVAIQKTKTNTFFGTSKIAKPVKPKNKDSAWSGSYVYFGYFDYPIRFRVLSPSSDAYGTTSLFLDSDEVLGKRTFDETSNRWADSDIRNLLNHSFFANTFTKKEQAAVIKSQGTGGLTYAEGSYLAEVMRPPVSVDDYVFLLDASEAVNEAYGYTSDPGVKKKSNGTWSPYATDNRKKNLWGTSTTGWWLRSAYKNDTTVAACIKIYDDRIYGDHVYMQNYGMAPAINVDLSKILFTTAVSGEAGKVGTEYKLTLKDSDIILAVQSGFKISGRAVTIPYQISGKDKSIVNQVSVVIRNKTNWNILYYAALDELSSGTGAFTLPSNLSLDDWGADNENGYEVLIIAEQVNKSQTTDYASEPVILDKTAGKNFKIESNVVYYEPNGAPYDDTTGISGKVSYNMTAVGKGDVVTVTATPRSGYVLKMIEVANGPEPGFVDITAKSSFTVGDADPIVIVYFQKLGQNEEPTYKIHYTVMYEGGVDETGISGTLTFNKTEAKNGEKITITATPVTGYVLYELGWTSGTQGSYVNITSSKTFKVGKADPYVYALFVRTPNPNTMTVKPKTATVKYKKLKKKNQTVDRTKVLTVTDPQGKVTYKLNGVKRGSSKKYKKYFKINASTGKVTVKKKLKKGTYKITCSVTAAGSTKYKKLTKKVTFKIKVK